MHDRYFKEPPYQDPPVPTEVVHPPVKQFVTTNTEEARAIPLRNTTSLRFYEILKELGELHDKKQADYGREHDPFANVRASEDWGMEPWVGCMIRANDKLRRLQTFARKGVLVNESVADSFRDLAVYAVIGLCLFEETH